MTRDLKGLRNLPSLMASIPTSSCFLMTRSISRSSTALSSTAPISPLACFSRASFSAAGRSRLPTWSARNGGLVRCMVAPFGVVITVISELSSPRIRSRVLPEIGTLGAHVDYSRHAMGTHIPEPVVMGPRFRGDDIEFLDRSLLSPHLIGHLHDPPQLRPLLLLREDIAFLGRGEAALR